MSTTYSLHEADPAAPAGQGGAPVRPVAGDPADLEVFDQALAAAHDALARAVVAAGRLAGSGVAERVEGVDLERVAALAHRLLGRDARAVVATGEVLRDAPVLAGLLADGQVSAWQALGMRGWLQGLSRVQRQVVDERVGAHIAASGGVDAFDADGLVDAVAQAAEDCRQQRSRAGRDARAQRANRVQLQQGFDGRVRLFGDYDPIAGAAVVNALDAAAAPPGGQDSDRSNDHRGAPTDYGAGDHADREPGDAGAGDAGADRGGLPAVEPTADPGGDDDADALTPRWVRRTARAVSLAEALVAIAADYLAGHACEHALSAEHARAQEQARELAAGTTRAREHAVAGAARHHDGPTTGGGHRGAGGDPGAGGKTAAADPDTGNSPRRGCGRARRARPLVVVHVGLDQLSGHPDGTVELNLRGGLPRVSAATVEALARSGDVQAVLFDGQRPLAATSKVDAARVPAATALAVRSRDRGCRFPASRDPIGHTDLHHLREQARGGDHDPDNLVCLSRRWHTTAHQRGWTLTLDPATGQLTTQRGGRSYRSLPRGAPLPPAPDPPPRDPEPDPPPHRPPTSPNHHHDSDDEPDDDPPF